MSNFIILITFPCRSLEASQKAKNITIKTLDSTMSKKKPNESKAVSISSKCADLNADLLNSLGVSKAILNYVIFCHQEDSNWPLDVGSKVKERFDEIFNSVKYKNCLKMVKDVRKKEVEAAKLEKNNALHYKSDKELADQKQKELKRKQAEATRLRDDIDRVKEELEPLREQLLQVQEEEKGFSENQKLLAEAETSLEFCRKEKEVLEEQVGEVLGEDVTEEELRRRSDGVERETKAKERELQELEERKRELEEDLAKMESKSQRNAAVIGKAVTEQENYLKQEKEREELLEAVRRELGLEDSQGDMGAALRKEEHKLKTEMRDSKTDFKEKETKMEKKVDDIKSKKSGLEEQKKREQADRMEHMKEIAQIKRQLSALAGSSEQLEKINKDWNEGEEKLATERNKIDIVALQEEIDQEKETVKELDANEVKLKVEAKDLEDNASTMAKIDHLKEDMTSKSEKMSKVLNKRSKQFTKLFGKVPEPRRLRADFKERQEEAEVRMKELESKRKEKESKLTNKTTTRTDLKRELEKKSSKRLELSSKCSDVLELDGDLEEEIMQTKEGLEAARQELQIKEAGKYVFKDQIEMLKKSAKPPCPTCSRDFKNKSEVKDLIQELEEQARSIPGKVASLEAKVGRLGKRLEELQQIRPEFQQLKQLEQEVAEQDRRTELMDKEIKKLRAELEREEGEHMAAESEVSELREVTEDVQVVEGLRKELEMLEERLEGLRQELGEQEGSRGLEEVRKELEVVSGQLRAARSNLESCQEQVAQQSKLLNNLDAEQNRLTTRKLEIEGQQQRRSVTEAKKEELDGKAARCLEEVKRCEGELLPVREELEEADRAKDEVRREGEELAKALQERERKLEIMMGNIERVEASIESYRKQGKDEQLKRFKKEKTDIESKLTELKEFRTTSECKISSLKVEVGNQGSRRRVFEDNLRLREFIRQEERHGKAVRMQRQALRERDWDRVERKKEDLNRKWNKLNADKNAMGGQQAEVERSVREVERELGNTKLRDASRRYREMEVSHGLRSKVAEDLNKYYIALDYAIMKYHNEKMKVVNKIIRELWLQVYRGNDIDYIEIKTDDGDKVQAGADKRATYAYRVVMVKNDTEMDMRGRCSAGQKVLSSLIIRLALAETFSTNCGIIALDEPTTNLDRENVESLANALAEIATRRAEQRNFQLVVITHDEDFIESLSRFLLNPLTFLTDYRLIC